MQKKIRAFFAGRYHFTTERYSTIRELKDAIAKDVDKYGNHRVFDHDEDLPKDGKWTFRIVPHA